MLWLVCKSSKYICQANRPRCLRCQLWCFVYRLLQFIGFSLLNFFSKQPGPHCISWVTGCQERPGLCRVTRWTPLWLAYDALFLLQTFAVLRFLLHYVAPVSVFVVCYERIFRVIRRQSKVVSGHAGRCHDTAMETTSRGQNTAEAQTQQQQHQSTGTKLSRAELNVIQTMVAVIVCFVIVRSGVSISNFLQLLRVIATPPRNWTLEL